MAQSVYVFIEPSQSVWHGCHCETPEQNDCRWILNGWIVLITVLRSATSLLATRSCWLWHLAGTGGQIKNANHSQRAWLRCCWAGQGVHVNYWRLPLEKQWKTWQGCMWELSRILSHSPAATADPQRGGGGTYAHTQHNASTCCTWVLTPHSSTERSKHVLCQMIKIPNRYAHSREIML